MAWQPVDGFLGERARQDMTQIKAAAGAERYRALVGPARPPEPS
jgi:hypothetical protein